jgi:hypothetical protein
MWFHELTLIVFTQSRTHTTGAKLFQEMRHGVSDFAQSGAHHFCLPMTNAAEDALRATRPHVAEWIDKLRLAGHVIFVRKYLKTAPLLDRVVVRNPWCVKTYWGSSGSGNRKTNPRRR